MKGIPAAIVALVIGCIAAAIAYRQYKVAHARFMLDLFEKRHEIYLYTATFLTELVLERPMEPHDVGIFRGRTAAAPFLFKREIADFLKDVSDQAAHADRDRAAAAAWATEQLDVLKTRFMPYMDLSDWR
ncbi:hypothetical protein [Paraburkholderia solisilvae]|nr:hypothetical protein [Paraburkholderia solisilvae]